MQHPGLRLPSVVVIGAMKCATTALHHYLDAHPQVSMSPWEETNFFLGPEQTPDLPAEEWWRVGQWHRGLDWYSSLFDPSAPVRGDTSPGYTSPDSTVAPERMAAVLPDARLVYLVRHPVDRAISQYEHHFRDGDERRPVAEALLDPDSQYIARGRYFERLEPFLSHFSPEQVHVVVQERLLKKRREELRRVFEHIGADSSWWSEELEQRWHVGRGRRELASDVAEAVNRAVADDVARLRAFLGDDLSEWGDRSSAITATSGGR